MSNADAQIRSRTPTPPPGARQSYVFADTLLTASMNDRSPPQSTVFQALMASPFHRQKVPAHRRYTTDPLTKFRRYGKFPCKAVLTTLILITLLIHLFTVQIVRNEFLRSGRSVLLQSFYPGNLPQIVQTLSTTEYSFSRLTDLFGFIQATTDAYYAFVPTSPGIFMYHDDNGTVAAPQLVLKFGALGERREKWNVTSYKLTPENGLGPFGDCFAALLIPVDATSSFPVGPPCGQRYGSFECRIPNAQNACGLVDNMKYMTIALNLNAYREFDPKLGISRNIDFSLLQTYTFDGHNGIVSLKVTITTTAAPVDGAAQTTITSVCIMLLFVFVTWDILLRIRAIRKYRVFKMQIMVSKQQPHHFADLSSSSSSSASSLESEEEDAADPVLTGAPRSRKKTRAASKTHMPNFRWMTWALGGDFCVLTFTILEMLGIVTSYNTQNAYTARLVFLGLSLFTASVQMLSYFEHSRRSYILVRTLSRALPYLGLFVTNVIFVFLAYAVFGVVTFGWYCPYFSDVDVACITLFATMNGDALMQTFSALNETDSVGFRIVGRVYMYTFIMLFIYNVINITLNIVQDSFYHLKHVLRVFQFKPQKDPEWRNVAQGSAEKKASPKTSLRSVVQQVMAKQAADRSSSPTLQNPQRSLEELDTLPSDSIQS